MRLNKYAVVLLSAMLMLAACNKEKFTVTLSSNIADAGSISGEGSYPSRKTVTVTAVAANDYSFVNWTENGAEVSAESSYSFRISSDRNLVANFKKDNPKLIFKFKFDPNQERLGNLGNPTPLPAGHAGQSPTFNAMAAHYIELAQGPFTQLGQGAVLYRAPETSIGGSLAIDFAQSSFAKDGEVFYEVPLTNVAPGDYEYLRVSLAYQNYDVNLFIDTTVNGVTISNEYPCTVASFIGFNTYITNYKVKNQTITVNGNRKQGYWGFEFAANFFGFAYNLLTSGQAPDGATTVVNPIQSTSPIPQGSCLVTGPFNGAKLHITGNEIKDVVVTVSLSTNKSFEWVETIPDGKWEPSKGEYIVDMGVRGMVPSAVY